MDKNGIHPASDIFTPEEIAIDPILHFFHFAHLPAALRSTSEAFAWMAKSLVENLPRNAERSVALRKLLEGKDAAVRANIGAVASDDNFMVRLEKERDELLGRILKLNTFLAGDQAGASPKQVGMLYDQRDHMGNYLAVLNARIDDLGGVPVEPVVPATTSDENQRIGEVVETGERSEPVTTGGHDIDRDGDPKFRD